MTVVLPPSVEILVIDWLRGKPEIAAIVADRVSSDLPPETTFPYLQIVAFDDDPITQKPLHLIEATVQVSAYGSTKTNAELLGQTARALLHEIDDVDHDEAVVASVSTRGWGYRPDDTYSPAKPRYTFDAAVRFHAHPA